MPAIPDVWYATKLVVVSGNSVALGDLNADGATDLVTANAGSNNITGSRDGTVKIWKVPPSK